MAQAIAEGRRADLISDEYQEHVNNTKNSITRYMKRNVERRVTSSSSSDKVSVTDSCWASAAFMLCGLSNGTVCLLNTTNLSKVYLFEQPPSDADRKEGDRREHHRSSHRSSRSSERDQAVGLDCWPLGENTGKLLLCMSADSVVQLCVVDTTSMPELRKLTKGAAKKILPHPTWTDRKCSLSRATVKFSPDGSSVLVVLHFRESSSSGESLPSRAIIRFAAFKTSGLDSTTLSDTCWKSFDSHRENTDVRLRYCSWWDEDSLLCMWSDGHACLYSVSGDCVAASTSLLQHQRDSGAVHFATATTASGAAGGTQRGLLAVSLGGNIVSVYTVCCAAKELDAKRIKDNEGASKSVSRRRMTLTPTEQTHCTEDITIRNMSLFQSFSWTLCAVLESGAVLFLDAHTMELLAHRPLKRIEASDAHLFCKILGRPLNISVVDHNTVTFLRAQ